MSSEEMVMTVDGEILTLREVRNLLGNRSSSDDTVARVNSVAKPRGRRPRKRVLSPGARERIAAAQSRRRAAQKRAAKAGAVGPGWWV